MCYKIVKDHNFLFFNFPIVPSELGVKFIHIATCFIQFYSAEISQSYSFINAYLVGSSKNIMLKPDKSKKENARKDTKKTEKECLLNGYAQPQNYKTGRVYVYGKNNSHYCPEDSDDENIEFEMNEIRSRTRLNKENGNKDNSNSELKKISVIERPVFQNDTLSKFALQYGCTV